MKKIIDELNNNNIIYLKIDDELFIFIHDDEIDVDDEFDVKFEYLIKHYSYDYELIVEFDDEIDVYHLKKLIENVDDEIQLYHETNDELIYRNKN